jgi:signal transduction histidine kinase
VPFRSGATPAVVEVFVSTRRLSDWAREERRRSFLLALGAAALLAFGVAGLTARWVGRPLRALSQAIEAGRGGASAAPAAAEIGPTEFRGLARAYNALTGALATRERESAARAELLSLEERARGFERTALVEQTASELAHEIGTPLHTMSGNLQLLRDDLAAGAAADHPQETAERVALVLSQIERVSGVVRRGLERGAWPPPHADTLNLAEVARRMVRFLEPALAAGGVKASVEGTGAPAIGDAAFVEHIVLNLVKNAIEALPRGGTVTLLAGARDARATLDVVDDGPGMADEVKSRLFEPYRTTKGARGTGLGLAVSRRLAEAQGGTLDLVAAARGTHWRLTLPTGDRA